MLYRTSLSPVFGLRREIDKLFEDTFGQNGSAPALTPAVDIRETANELTFEIELAGIKPEDVEVIAEKGVLSIRGEKKAERKEGDEARYHIVERTYGTFLRSFQLPQGIEEEKIDASFEHGMLTVRVPKSPAQQPRKIQINNGSKAGQQQVGAANQNKN
jgi:HSP20 family protein